MKIFAASKKVGFTSQHPQLNILVFSVRKTQYSDLKREKKRNNSFYFLLSSPSSGKHNTRLKMHAYNFLRCIQICMHKCQVMLQHVEELVIQTCVGIWSWNRRKGLVDIDRDNAFMNYRIYLQT